VFSSFASSPIPEVLGYPSQDGLSLQACTAMGCLGLALVQGPGGRSLRKWLPAILLLALAVEGLKACTVRQGLVRPGVGAVLVSVAYLMAIVGLVTWNARQVSRAEAMGKWAIEERLRSEDRFRTIFEEAPMGIALLDSMTGRILEVNAKYSDIVGRTREAVAVLDWMKITHPDDIQKDLDQMARLNSGEIGGFQMDKRLLREDGSVVWISMTIVPIQVEKGGSRCHLAMIEDLTQRRQVEDERQRLNSQLVQAQKMDSLGCLAGGVAHDMNNVLGAILGLASTTFEIQAPDSPAREALDAIIRVAERGVDTVKGLLSFARQAPSGEQELNLNEVVLEEARLLERTTLAKVRFELDLSSDLRTILGDAGALTHAFMNLCVNALDAMPESGTLTLRSRNVGPAGIEVQVADTGAGMSSEVLGRCLDPFYTTKEGGKGTGLGLSLVYRTVKAHHGQLEIQSRQGQGTCVRMRFPAYQPKDHAGAR
jgi:PAS domain S-box-containing protein